MDTKAASVIYFQLDRGVLKTLCELVVGYDAYFIDWRDVVSHQCKDACSGFWRPGTVCDVTSATWT